MAKKLTAVLFVLATLFAVDVLSQSTTVILLPNEDVTDLSTGWSRSPNSGSWYSKVDDPISAVADDDFIFTDQSPSNGNVDFGGKQVFKFVSPPRSLASGDVVVNVRARNTQGYNTMKVEIVANGFTIATQTFTLDTNYTNATLYAGSTKTREQIITYQVEITANGCQFLPTCGISVSALDMEVQNPKYRSGII